MTDTATFDAADAAFREIHTALAGTLTSTDVGALIDRASKNIADCDALAVEKQATASDPALPSRDALAAKQEGEGLTFVASRLRNLMPTLDRRRAGEADAEEQARYREQYDQAQKRVDEIAAKVTREYPKAVAIIAGLVAEIGKADAIAVDANRNLPRDVEHVPSVERIVGAQILARLHLPSLDGTMAHEMSGEANEAFRTELWNREQAKRSAEMVNAYGWGNGIRAVS